MSITAPYYEDSSQWGDYMNVTLEDIVNDFIMSRDQDDYTINTPRHKVLYQARQSFKEFHYDVLQEIKVVAQDLSPESLSITLPPDYVNYTRISWVDQNGVMHPLAENRFMNISSEYLQDNDYNILFDSEGCPLRDNNAYLERIRNNELSRGQLVDADLGLLNYFVICTDGFEPNRDQSMSFNNGSFKIDKSRGIIQFDTTVGDELIVLEYVSDGLYTGCEGLPEREIRVHKFAEDAIRDRIYYYLIKNRRNVPANEKARARKEYFNSRRLAKLRLGRIKYQEIIQSFRKQSRWIKQ